MNWKILIVLIAVVAVIGCTAAPGNKIEISEDSFLTDAEIESAIGYQIEMTPVQDLSQAAITPFPQDMPEGMEKAYQKDTDFSAYPLFLPELMPNIVMYQYSSAARASQAFALTEDPEFMKQLIESFPVPNATVSPSKRLHDTVGDQSMLILFTIESPEINAISYSLMFRKDNILYFINLIEGNNPPTEEQATALAQAQLEKLKR